MKLIDTKTEALYSASIQDHGNKIYELKGENIRVGELDLLTIDELVKKDIGSMYKAKDFYPGPNMEVLVEVEEITILPMEELEKHLNQNNELDLDNPPLTFKRTKLNEIPKYLESATADVNYDFCNSTYYIYHKPSNEFKFHIQISGQQHPEELNESQWLWNYHILDEWFVFSTINEYVALFKIEEGMITQEIECSIVEEHNLVRNTSEIKST